MLANQIRPTKLSAAIVFRYIRFWPKKHRVLPFLVIALVITTIFDDVLYIVFVLFLLSFWCPCMAINVSIQYNGGLLPDIIVLTQCYLHRGTRSNAMKKFCICSL